jgi:hypothetical protein
MNDLLVIVVTYTTPCPYPYLYPVAFLPDVFPEQDMRQCINHHAKSAHACNHAES